jgi:hypothetical protein
VSATFVEVLTLTLRFSLNAFFVDPKPKDMLTFPAHRACDAHLILSDEYARNILAGLRSETAKSFALSLGRPKKRLGNVAVAADEQ